MSKSTRRPIVLIFVQYFLPGYRGGGPIQSIANMVSRLGDEFDFRIVTRDRDLGDSNAYEFIKVNRWNRVGKANVFYIGQDTNHLRQVKSLIAEVNPNYIYLNSFFDRKFTLSVLLLRFFAAIPTFPIILAPRGEFSASALKIKRWKKRPFLYFVKKISFFKNIVWQASTEFEASDIACAMEMDVKNINLARNIVIVPDLSLTSNKTLQPGEIEKGIQDSDSLKICFLSRIVPMKNLDFALHILKFVGVRIQFDIYGPKESESYWIECEKEIQDLPQNIEVNYYGPIENVKVAETISKYSLFFVPSLGENFGHVFIEALSAGVPILISDRTPWRNLEAQNLGWDISLDNKELFVDAIKKFATMSFEKKVEMRSSCLVFAKNLAENSESLEMNRALFNKKFQ